MACANILVWLDEQQGCLQNVHYKLIIKCALGPWSVTLHRQTARIPGRSCRIGLLSGIFNECSSRQAASFHQLKYIKMHCINCCFHTIFFKSFMLRHADMFETWNKQIINWMKCHLLLVKLLVKMWNKLNYTQNSCQNICQMLMFWPGFNAF